MKWWAVFYLLSFTLHAQQATETARRLSESATLVRETMDYLSAMGPGEQAVCLARAGTLARPSQVKCLQTYQDFYADSDGDGKVTMDIYLGYSDMNGHKTAVDPLNRLALMAAILTKPCPANVDACGFESTDDGEVFIKRVTTPTGQVKTVQIRLRDSATGIDNYENVTIRREQQRAKSQRVREQFQQSLRTSEAVFYLGHSRYGGGPDFSPPELLPNGESNVARYQSRRTGLGDIVENMNETPRNMKFLGLYSCNSRRHFLDSIRLRNPELGLAHLNEAAGNATMIPGILGNINALVGMRCQDDMNRSIDRQGRGVVKQDGFF